MKTVRALAMAALLASIHPHSASLIQAADTQTSSWHTAIARTLGREGSLQPGDVYKVGFPRTDLKVTLGNLRVEPGLALGSWAAFKRVGAGDEAMVMGDLVLLTAEVNPVMTRLLENGLDVTALHNHLLGETPRLLYLHYEGRGGAAALAEKLKGALSATATPLKASPSGPPPALTAVEAKAFQRVQEILGHEGKVAGKVLQVAVPRPEKIECNGVEIPPAMGTATALNFEPTGDGVAATGDFVLLDDEVISVLHALRAGGIDVTAIHSHMLHDTPSLKFVHFWGEGPAEKIAGALRGALDKIDADK